MIADDPEILHASEMYPRRINAKEVLTPQKGVNFLIIPVADGTAKLPGRDHEFREPTPRREQPARAKISVENFKAKRKGSNGQKQKVTSLSYHLEPRVQHHVPREEETFPTPLKYSDVTRATHTNLDVLQENVLTIIGMWPRFEVYQIMGKDSRSSLY